MRAIKGTICRLIIGLTFLGNVFTGWAQPRDPVQRAQPRMEKYRVLTDRSLYVAGEEISFRIFNLSLDSLINLDWSKVYYVELVTPDGNSLARSKIPMDQNRAQGRLQIPGDISSGTFYLKGYTRWMRNFGPENYAFSSIEVINPKVKRVMHVDTAARSKVFIEKSTMPSTGTGPAMENLLSSYTQRSEVQLNLNTDKDDRPMECCISVVPKGSLEAQWESLPSPGQSGLFQMAHIPETKGISLSGKVEFAQTGEPAPYAIVYISILDKGRAFYCNYADETGNFYFAFPDEVGEKELFISASHPEPAEVALLIDQDYCTEPFKLPSFPIAVDSTNEQLIRKLSVNAQVREEYAIHGKKEVVHETRDRIFFYGDPTITVNFDDYIRLPTMEEYFSEVTPQVSVRSSKGQKRFVITGDHPDLDFYAPLLMIDGVAIFDVESALAISPRTIDRIEIVDAPYIIANVTFGGIINIISKNDNMGFIDLPASGLQVNYEMNVGPEGGNLYQPPSNPRIPDARNTLYWNPSVSLGTNESATINFQAGDTPGIYEVVIRGYTSDGSFVYQSRSFQVN